MATPGKPPDEWPKNWEFRDKHRKANGGSWDSGEVLKRSEHGPSQYSPYNFGTDEAVKELEMRCVKEGTPIISTAIKRTFYMNAQIVVGVCRGDETTFVFAEWHCSGGAIHGRPISEIALRALGVRP